jgi:hypothetical protein
VGREAMAQRFNQVLKDRLTAGDIPGTPLARARPQACPPKSAEGVSLR